MGEWSRGGQEDREEVADGMMGQRRRMFSHALPDRAEGS